MVKKSRQLDLQDIMGAQRQTDMHTQQIFDTGTKKEYNNDPLEKDTFIAWCWENETGEGGTTIEALLYTITQIGKGPNY